jgi:cobalamin biosynthesis Mg chelatase CobN
MGGWHPPDSDLQLFCVPVVVHSSQEKEERSKRKTEGPLSTKRFQALEHLLQQSEAYSQFLAEQLANIDEAAKEQPEEGQAAEAVEEAPAPKKGGKKKRKAAEAAAAEAKKAKSSKTPTEVGGGGCREGETGCSVFSASSVKRMVDQPVSLVVPPDLPSELLHWQTHWQDNSAGGALMSVPILQAGAAGSNRLCSCPPSCWCRSCCLCSRLT